MANDPYRAVDVVRHGIRDRARHEARQGAVAMRSDHDEVSRPLRGRIDDDRLRIARHDVGNDLDVALNPLAKGLFVLGHDSIA